MIEQKSIDFRSKIHILLQAIKKSKIHEIFQINPGITIIEASKSNYKLSRSQTIYITEINPQENEYTPGLERSSK